MAIATILNMDAAIRCDQVAHYWQQQLAEQANACAEVRVTIVVRVDLLFSPRNLAVFCRVEGVTMITIARRTAI